MRFMVMHKMTEAMEKGLPAEPGIIEAVGKLIEEDTSKYVSGAGLKPSSERVHIAYKKGRRTITDGPFTEAKELVAGFALMVVRSKDEAISWCDKFAAAMGGEVELFMGPVLELWDIGLMPRPENPPLRMLSMHKMDAQAEGDTPPDAAMMATMGALIEEMKAAGVLEAFGGLASTKKGARIHFKGGKRTVIDGPFTESKEMVAGFAILDLPSKEAAIEWGLRFGDITKVNEVEVRQMPEW